jgi:ubiquinone/menaquinone biosynthesis C-methylase UbiE
MVGTTHAQLTERHAALLEETLRASSVEALVELLWRLRRGRSVASPAPRALRQARELELVEPASHEELRLTALGAKVSDSMSEYAYWKERGKRHHSSDEVGALSVERLRGKRILEIGCGAGVNLLSLQRCTDVVGIDVEPLYLRFGEILARLEGVPVPARVCGSAEHLPFEDASFDIALFHGSLPYMRIEHALCETARVLRPGGRAIAIFSDLRQTLRDRLRSRRWTMLSPGVFLREARGFAGMIAYPWVGRLILKPFDPIHTTRHRTRRWLSQAGLVPNAEESRMGSHEVCFVADKPAGIGPQRAEHHERHEEHSVAQ